LAVVVAQMGKIPFLALVILAQTTVMVVLVDLAAAGAMIMTLAITLMVALVLLGKAMMAAVDMLV
jgi:hypothetical protein